MIFFFLPLPIFSQLLLSPCNFRIWESNIAGPLAVFQQHQSCSSSPLLRFYFHQLDSDKFDLIAVLIFELLLKRTPP